MRSYCFLVILIAIPPRECILSFDQRWPDNQQEMDRAYRQRHNKIPTAAERFRFFDEYLLSIRETQQTGRSGFSGSEGDRTLTDFSSDGGAESESVLERQRTAETALLERIRQDGTSPKFACCALGQVAGRHGFHCNAKFYENRIQMRNRNRAQTRQVALEDIEREPNYNEHLWSTFGNCVRKHAKSFHHCCYAARVLGSESVDLNEHQSRRNRND